METCFVRFDQLAKKGICCNFLSDKIGPEYFDSNLQYNAPEDILVLAYRFSKNVVLRNDYMPYEFTVAINKFSRIDTKMTVYEEYKKYV
jgi:hypothetical protein